MADGQLESHKSTTYQTTAYRSSSGAIVLNRIATTTTTQPEINKVKEENSRNTGLNVNQNEGKDSNENLDTNHADD